VSCYGTELTAEEIDRFSNLTGCEVITDIFLSSDIPVKVAKKIK
jgi:hypothetical protein